MNWFYSRNIKCIILCAGKGMRLDPEMDKPKSMVEIKGMPLLDYVVSYWKNFTDDFIFVVNHKKEKIIDYIKTLSVKAQFIEQKELKGIANALLSVENIAGKRFMLILGDCWCKGKFSPMENMEHGIGVWKTDFENDIKRSYSVNINSSGNIDKVEEKPKVLSNNLCGLGFYFFTDKVFEYIKKTPPSALRNEVEITDAIQNMIDGGEVIKPVFFHGNYVNVTFKDDIKRVESYLK